ncbi:hypothetical protein [Adonisia turfae]|nr:hypothetical protein [Adonisia turfae]
MVLFQASIFRAAGLRALRFLLTYQRTITIGLGAIAIAGFCQQGLQKSA